MARHQNKHIREAINYAERRGWASRESRRASPYLGESYVAWQNGGAAASSKLIQHRAYLKITLATFERKLTIVRTQSDSIGLKMKSYEFKLVLADVSDISDDQGDALFEAGCDDGTIVSRDGSVCVRFSRESTSLEQAINSAAADVERAGFQVDHVEVHCPV